MSATNRSFRPAASLSPAGPQGFYHYSSYVAQALKVLKTKHGVDSNAEPVVLEGVLMKYKPSVAHQYLERWCQVTRNTFSYYVSKAAPKGWQTKPLITVPLDCIDAVQKVIVTVQGNPQDTPLRYCPTCTDSWVVLRERPNVPATSSSSKYSSSRTWTCLRCSRPRCGLRRPAATAAS